VGTKTRGRWRPGKTEAILQVHPKPGYFWHKLEKPEWGTGGMLIERGGGRRNFVDGAFTERGMT